MEEQLQQIYQTFSLDQSTFKLTQELTFKYLQLCNNNQNFQIIARLALWLASKQQQITAIDGSLVYGSGISINSILNDFQNKGISNLDEIIEIGLLMIQELKIDQSCGKILTAIKNLNSILVMFFKKMEAILSLFNLCDQGNTIKHITWLLFLIIKKQINLQDVVQSTCVLTSILAISVSYLLNQFQVNCKLLQDAKLNCKSEEESNIIILQFLINQFKIRDLDLFETINSLVKQKYSEFLKQNVIKQLRTNNGFSIFLISIINSNQYKLDQVYKQILKLDEFDERLIIPDRQKNLTPKKLTPNTNQNNIKHIAMQSKLEQNRDQFQQIQQHRFQKLLNYELDAKITMSTNLKEIKLPKTVLMSPYAQQQIVATPMTEVMEMYNWIHEKQQPFKNIFKQNNLSVNQVLNLNQKIIQNQQIIIQQQDIIDKVFEETVTFFEQINVIEQNKSKSNQYFTLYLMMVDKNGQIVDEISLKSLVCFCIECVQFILHKQSQILDQLISKCDIQHFQLWKWMDFFLNQFDQKMPHQLKEHFLDIEVKFVSFSIWASDSQSDLIKFLNEINLNKCQTNNFLMNRVFKRVLHYCAFQIQILCNNLKMQEQQQEYVWITVKYIISEKTDHLRHHSLDQIVLASIYAIVKLTGNQLKFQQIINAYEQTNTWFSKQFIKKIVCNTYISCDSMGDIVSYYNQSFIPQIKQFMLQMSAEIRSNSQSIQNTPLNNKNPALNNRILDSPLREVLPRQFINISSNPNQDFKSSNYGLMTPSTQLLYAYQESPLLKQQPKIPVIPIQKENCIQNSNFTQNNKIDYSNETQEFILKKFEQLKSNKNKQINSKTSFSILQQQQGAPKIISSTRSNNNNSGLQQNSITQNSQISNEQNSTFCKLLNFEQQ